MVLTEEEIQDICENLIKRMYNIDPLDDNPSKEKYFRFSPKNYNEFYDY